MMRAPSAWLHALLALLLVSAPAVAIAQAERVERTEMHWRVNADATSVLERTLEATALTPQGTVSLGRVPIVFNRELESLEILEAQTLKADGRRIAVGPDGVVVQSGLAVGGTGISWPGVEIRQITFPDLAVGDRILLRWRKSVVRPVLPGWAQLDDLGLVPGIEYRDVRVRIEAPTALGLAVWANHLRATQATDGTTDTWTVEASVPAVPLDANPADVLIATPRVHASTYRDTAALAGAFATAFRERLEITDELRALARSIVGDRVSDDDKARAVHDWIRANIRYVAVFLGIGGYVPNPLPQVLRNRFGDCKDMTLLAVALLRAVDVDAAPALLNAGTEYTQPPLPLGLNHVIVYLPSVRRFFDPTANTVPYGALPFAVADKPATVALADGPTTLRTPAFSTAGDNPNAFHVRSHWRIDRDGHASAVIDVDASGNAALVLQERLLALRPAGDGAAAVRQMLASARLDGRGTLSFAPVQRDRQRQSLQLRISDLRNLLAEPSAGAIAPHPSMVLPLAGLAAPPPPIAQSRRFGTVCTPYRIREDFVLEFDPAFRVLRVPAALREAGPDGIGFEADYALEGTRVTGRRDLVLDAGRHLCSPQQYVQRRPSLQRITQHLRGTVLYEQ